jgi:hypothetical protein
VPLLALPSRRVRGVLAAALLAASTSSCLEWDRSTSTEVRDLTRYVSAVSTPEPGALRATYVPGPAPASGTGGQATAALPPIVLRGGAARTTFTSPTPFTRLIVAAEGIDGFYDLRFPTAVTSADVLIAYAQDVGAPAFNLRYAVGSGDGLGTFTTVNTAFLPNGTGEVQVNIGWDTKADVDLYVVDPLGAEIYYAERQSNSGGQLDIDSNAACSSDGPRAENIFWSFGVVPPRGEYEVRVNNWSACGVPATNYVVTIRTKDGLPQVITGRLEGAGNGGARGAGQLIGTFRY